MHQLTSSLALASIVSAASAAYQGFNYGNKYTDGRLKVEEDYKAEFEAAKGLAGTNGAFTSARLYTMLQEGESNNPIEAIPAAIDTGTSLLLGLWASAGDEAFAKELAALQNAIDTYGDDLAELVAGISIGSEDLYRITPTAIANDEFAGASPSTIVKYINQVRELISGTPLENAKLGHVDTWTAFVNGSNQAVIDACDWLGFDGYPYWEESHDNKVSNGRELFLDSLRATEEAAGDKEVWITETGWPVRGKTVGEATASTENAQQFWRDVGCPMFGSNNVWWYTFQDSSPTPPETPSFGVIGSDLTTEPLYDLSCEGFDTPFDEEDGEDNGTNGESNSGEDEDTDEDDEDGETNSDSNTDSDDESTSGSGSDSGSGSGSGSTSGTEDGGSETSPPSGAGRLSVGVSMVVACAAIIAMV